MDHTDDLTVYVVEDDAETRNSLLALVSSLGIAVEAFASGEEFLQRDDAPRPGCVLSDFRLSGMDGIELQHRLLQAGCKLPVILISGYLNVRAVAGALEQGVFRVIEKPYSNDEVMKAIQDAVEHDRAVRQRRLYRLDCEHRLESLDARERLTLELILAGHPNKAVQRRLGLSRRTVERIRSNILKKMESMSFVELAATVAQTRAAGGNNPHRIAPAAGRTAPSGQTGATAAGMSPDQCVEDQRNWQLLCCDLHDGAAQYLSAALLRLQVIEAQHEVPAAATPHLRMVEQLLGVALRDIRDVIAGRSPACCTGPEFFDSVKRLVEELAGGSGIEIELVESLGRKKLVSRLETAVHRILQECLNNAIRHSGSDRVRVEIGESLEALRLEVRDWGNGFDLAAVAADQRGLQGIRQRAELLGGKASIQTRPGWGTLVAVELPLDAA